MKVALKFLNMAISGDFRWSQIAKNKKTPKHKNYDNGHNGP